MDRQYDELYWRVKDGIRLLPVEVQQRDFVTLDTVNQLGPKDVMRAFHTIMPKEYDGFTAVLHAYRMLAGAGIEKPYLLMTKESFASYMRVFDARKDRMETIPVGPTSPLILLFTLDAAGREQAEALLIERTVLSKDEALEILASARTLPTALGSGVL